MNLECRPVMIHGTLSVFKLLSMVFFYDSFTCVFSLFRVFHVTNHIIIEFGGIEVILL